MDHEVGIGCIGLNGHQIHHVAASLSRARLAAFAGVSAARFQEALSPEERDGMVWHEASSDLLARDDLNLVSLCHDRRADQAADANAALEAGKNVLAEKPMATTQPDLDALRRVHAAVDQRLWTMLPMVYDPGFLGMKKIVQDGVIGEVVQVYALKSYPYHDSRPQEHEVDGGLLMQAGIHAVSLIGHVTGRTFEEVFAQETATGNPKSGELQMGATVACRLEGGALATVLCNYCNPPGIGYHGNDQIRVHGTKGMIELVDGFTRRRLVAGNRAPESFPDVPPVRTYPQDMIDAVLDGSPTLLTEADGFHFTEVVIRAQESVGEARPLHVAG